VCGTTTFYYQKNTPSKACKESGYDVQILREQYFTSTIILDTLSRVTTFYSLEWMYASGRYDCPIMHNFNDGKGEVINLGYYRTYKSSHEKFDPFTLLH